jgi:TIR domain
VFLRGAGVPEPFIVQMKALVAAMEPIQFYSCFISYSSKDQEFAERLHADLHQKSVRCWFAPHDVQGGKKLHEQIDEAIRVHEKLLLILSPDSMGSEWVKTELAKARKREVRENRRVLFPMRLCSFEELRDWECFDADTGKDSAREIREYFIPDFSDWKEHDKYEAAFERLMRDLKA